MEEKLSRCREHRFVYISKQEHVLSDILNKQNITIPGNAKLYEYGERL